MKNLSTDEVEYISYRLAKELLNFDEPMPPFYTRYSGKLESCLNQPFQTFDGKPLYRYMYQKAAVLFYLVIKNHPFENGNKRMAVTITLVFLYKNEKWLDTTPQNLYELACKIAESSRDEMETTVNNLSAIFKKIMTKS